MFINFLTMQLLSSPFSCPFISEFNTLQLLPCNYFRFPSCLFISFHSSWKISEIKKNIISFSNLLLKKYGFWKHWNWNAKLKSNWGHTNAQKKQSGFNTEVTTQRNNGRGRKAWSNKTEPNWPGFLKESKGTQKQLSPARKHEEKTDTSWIVHPTWRSLTQSIEKLRRSIYILLFIGLGWTINQFPRLDCCGLHIQHYNVCIMQTKTTYIVDIDNIDKEWHRIYMIWYCTSR